MRLILLATILLGAFLTVNSQQAPVSQALNEQQWEKLFSALEAEDWEKSAELAKQYLAKLKTDDAQKSMARLRYMLLFSSAGKVTAGKMSYEELKKVVDPLVGTEVQLPYGKIIQDCHGNFGALCLTPKGSRDVTVASANQTGTNIHAFVYTDLTGEIDSEALLGKFGAVRGVVESIQYNPNQSKIWLMRVFLKDGSIELAP
ncbi:MAG TPA: hypothetical protein VFS77_19540 [Pyrinomonadaceae bacterium]|nr:hypothetical protein [Pyrinomonadaceae bacterium]